MAKSICSRLADACLRGRSATKSLPPDGRPSAAETRRYGELQKQPPLRLAFSLDLVHRLDEVIGHRLAQLGVGHSHALASKSWRIFWNTSSSPLVARSALRTALM